MILWYNKLLKIIIKWPDFPAIFVLFEKAITSQIGENN